MAPGKAKQPITKTVKFGDKYLMLWGYIKRDFFKKETWLESTIIWIEANTPSCWRTIWNQTGMKVRFFIMTVIHTIDCVQWNSLTDEGVTVLKYWPAQCSALNVIDQIWAKQKRFCQKTSRNLEELWELSHWKWYLIYVKIVKYM